MKKVLSSLAIISGLIASTNVFASEATEKAQVFKVINNYANSIACEVEVDRKNVYMVQRSPEMGIGTYYVMWSGDVGCSGGSGTMNTWISEVSKWGSRPFIVTEHDVFKFYNEETDTYLLNSRFIESVKKIDSDTFEIISSDYDEDEANNFPAIKFKYILGPNSRGGWKVINREFLGRNTY